MPLTDWYALVGGHPALDLVNTVGWRHTDEEEDALTRVEDVLWWGGEQGLLALSERDRLIREADGTGPGSMRRVTSVRSMLESILEALARNDRPGEGELERLREAYTRAVRDARLEIGSDGLVWSWEGAAGVERVLHPVVVSMMELLGSDDALRVKVCGEDNCGWMFLDRSKNASRRWCSMQICGSRAKMRRHYRNKKNETGGRSPLTR